MLIFLAALVLATIVAITATADRRASAAPSITDLRAQVARIQNEVAAIDEQVGQAAEAYNGAVYQLGLINQRITDNKNAIRRATNRLRTVQGELAARLRAEYKQPPATPVQFLMQSRTASAASTGTDALRRTAIRDTQVIRSVRALRAERIRRAKQLEADQQQARAEVKNRAEKRAAVEALLVRRQAVLSSAKGALAKELAAAARRERIRREAAARRARTLLAQQRNNSGGSGTPTPTPSSGGSGGSGGTPTPTPGGSARNAQAARIAMRYLGVPYVWGGATPSGFDCSGLAMYAYAQVGVSMAHYTGAIYSAFPKVAYSDLQPGDLVFFSGLGHMGIYIGGGMMVHAPHTGDVVKVSSMAGRSYVGAVRP